MKIKALVLASALLAAGVANAAEKETYLTNPFNSNLFVGLSAGANCGLDGVLSGNTEFGAGLGLELTVGKWMTPDLGFSFDLSGLSIAFDESQKYFALGGDLLWNASNTFAGYNPDRVLSVVPYIHANLMLPLTGAGLGLGVKLPIAINRHWAIVPDFRAMYANDALFKMGGHGKLATFHALLGVQYTFGKEVTFTTKSALVAPLALAAAEAEAAKAATEAALEKANAENAALAADKAELEKANAEMAEELNTVAAQNAAIVKNLMSTPACVYFEIGQATLSVKELAHLDRIVKTMVAQGKNIKFTLTGSADKNTGSYRRNKQLCKQRANYICKLLTTKYGLCADQFQIETADCKTNKFMTIELNRAAIIEAAE